MNSKADEQVIVRERLPGLLAHPAQADHKKRRAVFLDRDGTITRHVGYVTHSDQLELLPGAADALRRFQDAGYLCVVVTNQSAVGRGLIDEATLHDIHTELCHQLDRAGARLDAIYYCPLTPTTTDETIIEHPARKPGPGMLLTAAADSGIDLSSSWMIGDRLSDMLAGHYAGCRGCVRVGTGVEYSGRRSDASAHFIIQRTVADAASLIVREAAGWTVCPKA